MNDESMTKQTPSPKSPVLTAGLLHALCIALMLLIMAADLAVPLGVAMGVPYVAVVLLSLWSPRKKFTLLITTAASLFTIAAFFLKPAVAELWKAVANRGLALFAIWATAGLGLQRKSAEERREQAVHQREEALEHIRILRGLLPICAGCKKIRDDRGYWTQIESYISTHSEAEFTHGLCPECASRLYPGYFKGEPDADK